MGELTIDFRGLTTHFLNVVPGVPHRAILPDASSVRFGFTTLPTQGDPIPWVLTPHISFLQIDSGNPDDLTVPHAMKSGWIYSGVHLQLANASPNQGLAYDDDYFERIKSASGFVENYKFSNDVVHGGRAASYFDLDSGHVSVWMEGASVHTRVKVHTEGAPALRVTPFPAGRARTASTLLTFADKATLQVANLGLGCGDTHLDYLLHFLTAEGGIPQHLLVAPVGYQPAAADVDPLECVRELLATGYPDPQRTDVRALVGGVVGHDASCSDSKYP